MASSWPVYAAASSFGVILEALATAENAAAFVGHDVVLLWQCGGGFVGFKSGRICVVLMQRRNFSATCVGLAVLVSGQGTHTSDSILKCVRE